MIYLLHSTVALGTSGRNASNHYIGYVEDGFLWERLRLHATGRSRVAIISAYLNAGASLYLVRVWPDGGRALERHLKSRGHYKSHCPVCSGILAPERSVNIRDASTLTARHVGLRSRKQIAKAQRDGQSGTPGLEPGLLVQRVIQVPNTFSGSPVGLTLAIPGGHASHAPVRTKTRADRSAGTKQPSSVSGRTEGTVAGRANRGRALTDPLTSADYEHQLTRPLTDQEGFQV